MDPRALADYIAGQLDGTYGPNEEGFIDASVEEGHLYVTYTDDEFGVKTLFRVELEEIV